MDDANGGGDRSGRDRQIYQGDDQTRNPGCQRNGDEVDDTDLSLTLGSPSQFQPTTSPCPQPLSSPFLPQMTGFPAPPDFSARYLTLSSLNNSFHPMGSQVPPVNYFPPPTLSAPSNQDVTLSLNSGDESVLSSRSQSSGNQRSDTIRPPFPWATNIRGKIQTLEQLESKQITRITGDVQCKHCEKVYQVSYDLRDSFSEVGRIFASRKMMMRERALEMWTHPEAANCEFCGREKTVKPVIADRKSNINWLFMLLGQTLGYCTLEQLKYFCKHSKSHRTGAKDRVLYLTYLGLCKMLDPNRDLFRRTGR